MPKSVYFGTKKLVASKIVGGDYSMFKDGMLVQQTFLDVSEAIGAAWRSLSSESDKMAVVQLFIRSRSFRQGNRIKNKHARQLSEEELNRLTPGALDRPGIKDLPVGIVMRTSHRIFIVEWQGDQCQCSLRRRLVPSLRQDKRKSVVVGDRVRFRTEAGFTGVIEVVMGRTTQYARISAPEVSSHRHAVGLANIEKLVILSAVKSPPVWLELIDRYLVIAESAGIEPLICVSKVDLLEDLSPVREILDIYSNIGYPVLATSVTTGEGIDSLREWVGGTISSLVGLSGVRKSSLLNAIRDDLVLATKSVNERRGGGRHTTSNATLYKMDGGGYLADTPGIRELNLMDLPPNMNHCHFPEFVRVGKACGTSPCYHLGEGDCAVTEALSKGTIAGSRYRDYVAICTGGRGLPRSPAEEEN